MLLSQQYILNKNSFIYFSAQPKEQFLQHQSTKALNPQPINVKINLKSQQNRVFTLTVLWLNLHGGRLTNQLHLLNIRAAVGAVETALLSPAVPLPALVRRQPFLQFPHRLQQLHLLVEQSRHLVLGRTETRSQNIRFLFRTPQFAVLLRNPLEGCEPSFQLIVFRL